MRLEIILSMLPHRSGNNACFQIFVVSTPAGMFILLGLNDILHYLYSYRMAVVDLKWFLR